MNLDGIEERAQSLLYGRGGERNENQMNLSFPMTWKQKLYEKYLVMVPSLVQPSEIKKKNAPSEK